MSLNLWIRLPPVTADTPLEDIRQRIITELGEDRLGYLTPYEATRTEVHTTEEFSDSTNHFNYKHGVAIGPNLPLQLLIVAGISAVIGLVIATRAPLPFPNWMSYPLSFAAVYGIFRLIPDFHRKISIDPHGIQIHSDLFEWANLVGTYTAVTAPINSRYRRVILVIIDKQGNFYAHEFTTLSVRLETLCAVIEYFRVPNTPYLSSR